MEKIELTEDEGGLKSLIIKIIFRKELNMVVTT
jgi:hypothetical protein